MRFASRPPVRHAAGAALRFSLRFRPNSTPPVPVIQELENRCLLSVSYYAYDGTGNNLVHYDWGSAGENLLRLGPPSYADGISTPAGATRPSARVVSNTIVAHPADEVLNNRDMAAMIYAWGQFIDHDLDLTADGSEAFNIAVPAGDPQFDPTGTGTQVLPFNRSEYDPATGTSRSNPRQQPNEITAWLDGSAVYGSDAGRNTALRAYVGGRMLTSDGYTNGSGNLLPLNTMGLPNANDAHLYPDDELFVAGDVRVNENIELSAMQTLFMREHNRLAAQFAAKNPLLTDEQLYQKARRWVIAEIQVITYKEWLPALLGANAMAPYTGYKSWVNPGIANEFSTVAFRIGHSLLGNDVKFLDNNGDSVRDEIPLSEAFSNPQIVKDTGIDGILKYLASDRAEEVDNVIVDGLRNFLFGPPGSGGEDLASRNIQRGRDHGIADYNSLRAYYGLPRVTSFAQISSNVAIQQKLQSLYGNVNNIDPWVGGLAENHVAGSSVGPLFRKIIADQFTRCRDGDRFWYTRTYSGSDLCTLENTHLADIIARNTTTTNLQDNVFFFKVSISGQVFQDLNHNGRRDFLEPGLAGCTIQVFDDTGALAGSAVTGFDGRYTINGLDLGTFSLVQIPRTGWTQDTPNPANIVITRGTAISNINFGDVRGVVTPTTSSPIPDTTLTSSTTNDLLSPDTADVLA